MLERARQRRLAAVDVAQDAHVHVHPPARHAAAGPAVAGLGCRLRPARAFRRRSFRPRPARRGAGEPGPPGRRTGSQRRASAHVPGRARGAHALAVPPTGKGWPTVSGLASLPNACLGPAGKAWERSAAFAAPRGALHGRAAAAQLQPSGDSPACAGCFCVKFQEHLPGEPLMPWAVGCSHDLAGLTPKRSPAAGLRFLGQVLPVSSPTAAGSHATPSPAVGLPGSLSPVGGSPSPPPQAPRRWQLWVV